MITRREPRSRQQRPYWSQTMRPFSMPLSGITAMPFASGAADAAVANSAEAPSASEIITLFILNSCELNSCEVPTSQWLKRPIVPQIQPSIGSLADGTDSFGASINIRIIFQSARRWAGNPDIDHRASALLVHRARRVTWQQINERWKRK